MKSLVENLKAWEDIPHVKLGDELKKQEWWSSDCKYTLYPSHLTKSEFEKGEAYPKKAILYITLHVDDGEYELIIHGTRIEIDINWDDKRQRFRIRLEYPYGVPRHSQKCYKAKTVERALTRIKLLMDDAMIEVKRQIEAAKKEKERLKKAEEKAEQTCRKFNTYANINVLQRTYSAEAPAVLSFQNTPNGQYAIRFYESTKGKNLFIVVEIKGLFTMDEMKQFIEIVGGNPRAIAEKLTK